VSVAPPRVLASLVHNGGTGFIAAAVTADGGGAITLAAIGTLWLALACLGFNSSRRLAWSVEVAPDTVTLSGPRLRIEIPPREVLEVRAAPWDYTGREALDLLTANNGLIRLGPARHVADFTALRQVNPATRLPGDRAR
jgi:hypothetical protein